MTQRTEERFAKLPRWAQNEIARLEGNVRSLEKNISETVGEHSEETGVRLVRHTSAENDLPVPRDTIIQFDVPHPAFPKSRRNYVQARFDDDEVYIYCSDSVEILPDSSNTFRVRLRHR